MCLLWVGAGCESVPVHISRAEPPLSDDKVRSELSIYTRYAPVKIDIMPLTEFVSAGNTEEGAKINVYVSLLDSFGCQVKSAGVFRFELYERVERSAEPKGRRVVIWPDIDLTDAAANNENWRDFLRAYEFNLDFDPQGSQSYVLQVTCLCPGGKRLSAEFGLEHTE